MAIDFPSSPTVGQVHVASAGNSFVYQGGAWTKVPMSTALPKNYILNPMGQVSQQNGETAGTTNAYYIADQWALQVVGIAVTASRTTSTDFTRMQTQVTTGKALAAGDYWFLMQVIEGQRIADWLFGTANAKQLVLRFLIYTGTAGTYTMSLRNYPATRSFTANYAVTASSWNLITIPIPGDTAGTWATDSGGGCSLCITPAAGSTFVSPSAGWNAGNFNGAPGASNGALTTSNIYYLKEVGLYLDPYKTGVAPPFVYPPFAKELNRCQRYWQRSFGARGWATAATTVGRMSAVLAVPMRITPALAIAGAPRLYDTAVTFPYTTISSPTGNTMSIEYAVTCTGGTFTAGKAALQYWDADTNYVACSARM